MLKLKDTRVGKKVSRDNLVRSQAYSDEFENIILVVDVDQVLLLPQCAIWDLHDQYSSDDEFTEVDMEVIIS